MVAVAYRGFQMFQLSLSWISLVVWRSGRLWEVAAYKRWSHMEVPLKLPFLLIFLHRTSFWPVKCEGFELFRCRPRLLTGMVPFLRAVVQTLEPCKVLHNVQGESLKLGFVHLVSGCVIHDDSFLLSSLFWLSSWWDVDVSAPRGTILPRVFKILFS